MAGDVVLVDIADRVAVITINRPDQRNALNRAVRRELPAAITRCDADDDVDVMILTGADPAFSAGVDLKEFGSGQVQQGEGFAEVGDAARLVPGCAAAARQAAHRRGQRGRGDGRLRGRAQLRLPGRVGAGALRRHPRRASA